MSTLDINLKRESVKFTYISIFTIIFSVIYEYFSHGVISKYMIFSFLIPFLLGTVIYFIGYKFKIELTNINLRIHNSFIITLLLGSIIKGVLEIYGTTNSLLNVYIFLSVGLLLLNLGISVIKK